MEDGLTIVSKMQRLMRDNLQKVGDILISGCLLYTSPSPRDVEESRMPSSA